MPTPRLDANLALLDLLHEAAQAEPDQRFGQLLWTAGVLMPDEEGVLEDPFAEESTAILRRVEKRMQALKQRRAAPE